jgi:hypothetical protein
MNDSFGAPGKGIGQQSFESVLIWFFLGGNFYSYNGCSPMARILFSTAI